MAALTPSDPGYTLDQLTLNKMAVFLLDHEVRFFSKDKRAWDIEIASYGFTFPSVTKERETKLRKLCKDRGWKLFENMKKANAARVLNDTTGQGSGAAGKGEGEIINFKVWCQVWKNPGWDGTLTMPAGWTGGDVWNVTAAPTTLAPANIAAPNIPQGPHHAQMVSFQTSGKSTQSSTRRSTTFKTGGPSQAIQDNGCTQLSSKDCGEDTDDDLPLIKAKMSSHRRQKTTRKSGGISSANQNDHLSSGEDSDGEIDQGFKAVSSHPRRNHTRTLNLTSSTAESRKLLASIPSYDIPLQTIEARKIEAGNSAGKFTGFEVNKLPTATAGKKIRLPRTKDTHNNGQPQHQVTTTPRHSRASVTMSAHPDEVEDSDGENYIEFCSDELRYVPSYAHIKKASTKDSTNEAERKPVESNNQAAPISVKRKRVTPNDKTSAMPAESESIDSGDFGSEETARYLPFFDALVTSPPRRTGVPLDGPTNDLIVEQMLLFIRKNPEFLSWLSKNIDNAKEKAAREKAQKEEGVDSKGAGKRKAGSQMGEVTLNKGKARLSMGMTGFAGSEKEKPHSDMRMFSFDGSEKTKGGSDKEMFNFAGFEKRNASSGGTTSVPGFEKGMTSVGMGMTDAAAFEKTKAGLSIGTTIPSGFEKALADLAMGMTRALGFEKVKAGPGMGMTGFGGFEKVKADSDMGMTGSEIEEAGWEKDFERDYGDEDTA